MHSRIHSVEKRSPHVVAEFQKVLQRLRFGENWLLVIGVLCCLSAVQLRIQAEIALQRVVKFLFHVKRDGACFT